MALSYPLLAPQDVPSATTPRVVKKLLLDRHTRSQGGARAEGQAREENKLMEIHLTFVYKL